MRKKSCSPHPFLQVIPCSCAEPAVFKPSSGCVCFRSGRFVCRFAENLPTGFRKPGRFFQLQETREKRKKLHRHTKELPAFSPIRQPVQNHVRQRAFSLPFRHKRAGASRIFRIRETRQKQPDFDKNPRSANKITTKNVIFYGQQKTGSQLFVVMPILLPVWRSCLRTSENQYEGIISEIDLNGNA